MNREIAKIDNLKPAKYNPRKITKKQYNALKNNIKELGFVRPIVVNKDNTVIGGHQTLKVLKELGYNEVDIVRVDLPEKKEKLLNIALNKSFGDFDEEQLSNLIIELDTEDLSITGFSDSELKSLANKQIYPEVEISESIETKNKCPKCGYIW